MRLPALAFFAILLTAACQADTGLRLATFNIAMGLEAAGQMEAALRSGNDRRLQKVAEILQRVRPDIVLLNEFDYDPAVPASQLINDNYLARGQNGQPGIEYPFHFRAAVNTGADSGLDLDQDGELHGPGDAWGFGQFPGQYGMMILSRYPLDAASSRSFQEFPWSALPGAQRPLQPDGAAFHPDPVWRQLRLSSKSHWDLAFEIDGKPLHLLAHHPTPPVFDGPEDRNGRRNYDEIRFWVDYSDPTGAAHIVDDNGVAGGIRRGVPFVIAGDFNSDPVDGDSRDQAIGQLLRLQRIDASCVPISKGATEAAAEQGGVNLQQQGPAATDTADFNDRYTGNLRLDYLLPSRGLAVRGCGVFWPGSGEEGQALIEASDHRLVWLDIQL
jgi:endonuclease/exonuclease/phosphatase family metal-dependent hydrolase